MGNQQTTLNINSWFKMETGESRVSCICINFDQKAITDNGTEHDRIYAWFKNGTLRFLYPPPEITPVPAHVGCEIYQWRPKSHMRDFEIISPFNGDEISIARGQGIGIIVDEQAGIYCKLIYKRNKNGLEPVNYVSFNTQSRETWLSMISADLGLGYDCIHIKPDGQVEYICEPRDERDEKETLIIFPHLKQLAKYD